MGFVTGFYGKGNFSQAVLDLDPGLISISSGSTYSNPSNWSKFGNADFPGTDNGAMYYKFVAKADVRAGTTGIQLSAGGLVYSMATHAQAVTAETRIFTTDTLSNSSTVEIKNALLCGEFDASSDPEQPNIQSIWIQFLAQADQDDQSASNTGRITIDAGSYTQTKVDGQRTTWSYTGGWNPSGTIYDYQFRKNTVFYEVRFYKGTIFNDGMDFYVFAFGVSGDEMNNTQDLASSEATFLIAIPCKVFKDAIPRPYVGPVTPEGVEGFKLPSRGMWEDSIPGRILTDLNPFGFNNGSLHLIRQLFSQYQAFMEGIYHGTSGTILGQLGQLITSTERKTRPSEEVDVMTKGILSCKLMPDFGSSGDLCYTSTICGYPLFGSLSSGGVLPSGLEVDQLAHFDITPGGVQITRTCENFLDFEPYTSITLHLPYVSPIPIDPSVLYGNIISIWGYVDKFTGLICYNIEITDAKRTWLYATVQGNCAIEMPIVGAGSSTTQAIIKIASGLGSIEKHPINGVFEAIQGLESMNRQIPNSKQTGGGLTPFVDCNIAYLTIDTPLPENPANYAELYGTVVRKEGKVGDYKGYSEFSAVDLSTTGATEAEKEEIIRLLRAGVFV